MISQLDGRAHWHLRDAGAHAAGVRTFARGGRQNVGQEPKRKEKRPHTHRQQWARARACVCVPNLGEKEKLKVKYRSHQSWSTPILTLPSIPSIHPPTGHQTLKSLSDVRSQVNHLLVISYLVLVRGVWSLPSPPIKTIRRGWSVSVGPLVQLQPPIFNSSVFFFSFYQQREGTMLTLILLLLSSASCFSASAKGEWILLMGCFGDRKRLQGVPALVTQGNQKMNEKWRQRWPHIRDPICPVSAAELRLLSCPPIDSDRVWICWINQTVADDIEHWHVSPSSWSSCGNAPSILPWAEQ